MARALALVCALVVVLFSPARAVSVDAAYQNLTYTSSGSVPAVGYWQLVAVDNAWTNVSIASFGSRAVSAETDFTIRVSNVISNLNTSWPNPYYMQFRQTVKFVWNAGVNVTDPECKQFEPQFELVDAYQTGYLLEDVRITDTSTVQISGTSNYNVTLSINYTYLNGANTGNPTPITDFKIRAKQSFIVYQGGNSQEGAYNKVIGKKPLVTISQTLASYGRQRDVSDFTPYMKQNADNLDAIANGIVTNSEAADILDGANDNFVAAAGSLEAGQAELEGAADASLDAVDYGKIDMLGTYSQSISFWGRILNALPTVTGAFWEVLVFGFLIAFLVFILRLVR